MLALKQREPEIFEALNQAVKPTGGVCGVLRGSHQATRVHIPRITLYVRILAVSLLFRWQVGHVQVASFVKTHIVMFL